MKEGILALLKSESLIKRALLKSVSLIKKGGIFDKRKKKLLGFVEKSALGLVVYF